MNAGGRAPNVEIVTIGTEILLGHMLDTNAPYIARALADLGVDVYAKHSVGDNAERLAAMFEDVLERADGAIATGGLGPTVDDLTKDAVARAARTSLALHEPSLAAIERRFASFGRPMTENNRRQAFLPAGAFVLENPHGTAPGFVAVRPDGKFIACMPGVPREMKPMLAERLAPWLLERFGPQRGIHTRTLHTVGVGESELDRRIEPLFRSLENPKIAMLAHGGRVDVKIMAKATDARGAAVLIDPVERELRAAIGPVVFGTDDDSLESAILDRLAARGRRLGTAESITGGAIADALVRVPGASRVFAGGIVAYANAVKIALLRVDERTIARYGAVSEETAREMAAGARARLGVDFAVATTGIAGPSGATAEKPLGLVWFAVAGPERTVSLRATIPGERDDVRRRARHVRASICCGAAPRTTPALERQRAAAPAALAAGRVPVSALMGEGRKRTWSLRATRLSCAIPTSSS